ncbi:RDD family protein [Paenibacillus sp. Y412MC10]|uniref:RDD family protein n=1 Tax=Geobacillus sp. (strain Y412MC10) TaxID=481743 RepID=UPI000178855A|nr:RDD family protein [Paenibacillus sp. Y412MC10]ACX66628.1 RDD domain containing protein [Paenibacillus sp. Y412MC10]
MNAGFVLRFKAFMIDYLFILIYLVVLFLFNAVLFPSLQQFFAGSLVVAQFTGFLMVTLPVSLYFILSDSVIGGQSFGKRKMGIRVVNSKHGSVSVIKMIYRTALKFLPWELSHFLVYRLVHIGDEAVPLHYYFVGGVIYLLILTYISTAILTKEKKSLYDMISRTTVIRTG